MKEIIEINLSNISDIPAAASQVAGIITATEASVVTFYGEMGAGKTTFIRALVEAFGVNPEEANSPSFSIINEYDSPRGAIYHFDLYRLDSLEEAMDIGVEEYLYSGSLCLLEWSERIEPLIPDDAMRIDIRLADAPGHPRTLIVHPAAC